MYELRIKVYAMLSKVFANERNAHTECIWGKINDTDKLLQISLSVQVTVLNLVTQVESQYIEVLKI